MQNVHFTPTQVAKMLGVNVSTVKRWVDKGFITAEITAGGHRRISRENLKQFTAGYPQYAKKSYVLNRLKKNTKKTNDSLWKNYYGLLLQNNVTEATKIIDRLYLSGQGILDILSHIITPTLRHIGDEWFAKKITIYEEHRMSFGIRSDLIKLEEYIPHKITSKSPRAILACAPGEHHEIPLMLVGLILKQNGCNVHPLGINIPIQELLKAADRIHPKVISITKTYTKKDSQVYFNKLFEYATDNNICIAFGGTAWEKKMKHPLWKKAACVHYFPTLQSFDQHLKGIKKLS